MRRAGLLPFVLLFAGSPLHASTWRVGGPDGQFDEIQPAIDAAAPGDVILVRATKLYKGFVLDKGLTIHASRSSFGLVDGAGVEIVGVTAGQVARIGGIEALNTNVRVFVHKCQAEVTLEDIDLRNDSFLYSYEMIAVSHCANVDMTDVTAIAGPCLDVPAIVIYESQVQLTNVLVVGGANCGYGRYSGDGNPGPPGLTIDQFSRVVLANPSVTGGRGAGSGDGCDQYSCPHGGRGGPGLLVETGSDVLILGLPQDSIVGGQGGPGQCMNPFGCLADGGNGGPGIRNDDSEVTISGVQPIGGKAGGNHPCFDCHPPSDGPSYQGSLTFINPPFGTLQMTGPFYPGASFSLLLTGASDSSVLLLFSSLRGWIDLPPGYVGAPWTALPGTWFVGMQAGSVPASGELQLTLTLPADPALRGFAITSQAALFLQPNPTQLTNGATRIVGE